MDRADFPWRPLGQLLVDDGVLAAADLEQALAEQRRTGRLLGHVLVSRGYVSAVALAEALARQHGVDVRLGGNAELESRAANAAARDEKLSATVDGLRAWQPLGSLLVERAFVSEQALGDALAEQRERPGARLGEILVEHAHLSGRALATALAWQHGIELADGDEEAEPLTVIRPPADGEPVYHVCDVAYEPTYRHGPVLYETTNFLEAADFACDHVATEAPEAVEIVRRHAGASETVWTYSETRAEAAASSQKRLVDTFGFDPMRWNPRS